MNRSKWVVIVLALGMMAATAGLLHSLNSSNRLGQPGVRIGDIPIYDTSSNLISKQSIPLPEHVLDMKGVQGMVDKMEADTLPQDTTYGLEYYYSSNKSSFVQTSVILMGTDHTSIHQPQYCLYAQDWTITKQERIQLPVNRPHAYSIPAVKIMATHQQRNGTLLSALYVYWFVSADQITSEEGSRLWSMWKTMLQKGKLERWAYISYFAPCSPGHEDETFDRLKKMIQTAVPDFQTAVGPPTTIPTPRPNGG